MNRTAALGLPALALALALTGCSSDSTKTSARSTPTQAAPGAAPSSAAASTSPSTSAATGTGVQTITLNVAGGKVSGDTGRARVKLGSTVDVAVTADVAEEVHIHGYDLMVDTVPGQTVHKQFVAKLPGVFEIELEQSKTQLTRLQVQ